MMPSSVERVYWARRLDTQGYVEWLAEQTGMPVDESLFGTSRNAIDYAYERRLAQPVMEEKPTWVEAAEEVLETQSEDPEPELVKEEEEEEEEEEMIVPEADNPFSEQDYDSMTVRELQDICRERELTVRGTKAEVVMRLRRDDEGIVEQETEDETEAPSEEAAEIELDTPSEESEAVTEDVTDNDNSGETSNTDEEE